MKKFDIFGAACKLIGQAQAKSFRLDIDYFIKKVKWPKGSYLLTVDAYVDHMGVLRAQGRTDLQAGIPELVKHPIVLPGDGSVIARLIIEAEHLRLGHNSGVSKLQMAVNVTYIMRAPRERVNKVEKACVVCQKLRRKPAAQIMGVPHDRQLQSIKPFTNVSLDFAGPFKITLKRPTHRAYILVATCMQIKAVHLEMTLDLTTDSVLQALSRTASCRGEIQMLHSDNGPSFVKAKKLVKMSQMEQELCDDLGKLDWDKIAASSQSVGVLNWTFSAPRSPEGNGTAESSVKLAKVALKDTFRDTRVTYDEFRTALKKAEARINARPLTYIPADHWEAITVLTPSHMLISRLGTNFAPEAPMEDFKEYCKHWEMAKSLETQFCTRYSKLCIADIMSRPKWAEMRDNLKPGQVVLVTNDGLKRCDWRLGMVLQVKKDLSGVVRTVNVKIKNPGRRCSKMTRHVRQLVPLSVFNEGIEDIPMGEADEEKAIMAEASARKPGPCTLKNQRGVIKKAKAKKTGPRLETIIENETPAISTIPGPIGARTRSKTSEVVAPETTTITVQPIGTRTRSRTGEAKKDATSNAVLTIGPGATWSARWNEMSGVQEVKETETKLFNYNDEVTQEEPELTYAQV
jgi:transposase InsO family protein